MTIIFQSAFSFLINGQSVVYIYVSLRLQFCSLSFFTSHGRYNYRGDVELNKWFRITMVYDPESATNNSAINKICIDNQMYPMVKEVSANYSQGTGQMGIGRKFINIVSLNKASLTDDLKMWNQKLSNEEIIGMSD